MKVVIDIKIKKIPKGNFRKYTKEQMVNTLLQDHPLLLDEVFDKSYFIEDVNEAADFLADAFIEEALDIDTLESDEERKKRIPPDPADDNISLWDKLSEEM